MFPGGVGAPPPPGGGARGGGGGGQLLQGGDEPEDQQCIADEAKGKEKYNLIVEGVNEWRTRE